MISDLITKIYINTGNIINSKEVNRRASQSPVDEVVETLSYTLNDWAEKHDPEKTETSTYSKHINSNYAMKVDKEDRINLKLTVKVFLQSFNPENLNEAINEVMQHLDATLLDSVIIALPSMKSPLMDLIKPLWVVLENFVKKEKILTIGVTDLDTGQLKDLYDWAQVKPSVNQVNLESCCTMPPDLTAYAKEKDIQLLTHNDPKVGGDLFPKEKVEKLLETVVNKPKLWKAEWIVRYAVVVKCRGIIQNKGYLLCTTKEIK